MRSRQNVLTRDHSFNFRARRKAPASSVIRLNPDAIELCRECRRMRRDGATAAVPAPGDPGAAEGQHRYR